ncbi:MAG: hypothetical protein ABFC89_12755 [Methanospirillum sp.]
MIPDEELDRFAAWLRSKGYTAGSAKAVRSYVRRADRLGAASAEEVNAATRIPGTDLPHFSQTTRTGMRRALDLYKEFRARRSA